MTARRDILGRPPIMREVVPPDAADDGRSIADLCEPLSATVLPRSAQFGTYGQILRKCDLKRNRTMAK